MKLCLFWNTKLLKHIALLAELRRLRSQNIYIFSLDDFAVGDSCFPICFHVNVLSVIFHFSSWGLTREEPSSGTSTYQTCWSCWHPDVGNKRQKKIHQKTLTTMLYYLILYCVLQMGVYHLQTMENPHRALESLGSTNACCLPFRIVHIQ